MSYDSRKVPANLLLRYYCGFSYLIVVVVIIVKIIITDIYDYGKETRITLSKLSFVDSVKICMIKCIWNIYNTERLQLRVSREMCVMLIIMLPKHEGHYVFLSVCLSVRLSHA